MNAIRTAQPSTPAPTAPTTPTTPTAAVPRCAPVSHVRRPAELVAAAVVGILLLAPVGDLVYVLAGHPAELASAPVEVAWALARALLGAAVWAGHRGWLPGTGPGSALRTVLAPVAARWPSLAALLLTADQWIDGSIPTAILAVLGAEYFVIGVVRRSFASWRVAAWQAAGAVVYLVATLVALQADPRTAGLIVATGWLVHGLWDVVVLHRMPFAWRWFAEACLVLDLVVGLTTLWVVL